MTSRPKYNQYLTSNRRQVPAGKEVVVFIGKAFHIDPELIKKYDFTHFLQYLCILSKNPYIPKF